MYINFQFSILFTFLAINLLGQCDGEYSSASYDCAESVTAQGDTINKLDESGFYEGLHLYSANRDCMMNDSTFYIIGSYHHGLPIGEWKEHCKDGNYSIGHYNSGIQCVSKKEGGMDCKNQGIYAKIGVWKSYSKNGKLVRTVRYDRVGNTNKTFVMDSTGKFILVKYWFNDGHRLDSRFKKQITKEFTDKGIPIYSDSKNFWREVFIEYYPTGTIQTKSKWRKILGKKTKTTVTFEYNEQGKVECKTICYRVKKRGSGVPIW